MSFQARIAKKLLHFYFSGWSAGSVEEQRARQEKTARFNRLPDGVRCTPVRVDDIPAEWIEVPGVDSGVILYLHGGAFALGSVNVHRELVARLARDTRTRILAVDYRLAPEHPFPAALEDTTAVYRWLLTQGYDASQVILCGDSAGGGLAIATLLALRTSGEPLPAGAVCISPWVDLALSGASIESKADADPILSADGLSVYSGYYAADLALDSPLLSPLYADLAGLPPLLIQVGTEEILLDDAIRLAEKARAAGVDAELEVYEGLFHVFHLFAFLPETQKALAKIGAFVSKNVKKTVVPQPDSKSVL